MAMLVLVGCSAKAPETVPSGALTQFDFAFPMDPVRRVLVLVVDDSPTADAASLRAAVSAALRPTFEASYQKGGFGPAYGDPAARPPADLRAVVVHPSAKGAERAIGPSDNPRLALVAAESSLVEVYALADATGQEIGASVAAGGAEYALADAASSTIDLVMGARLPADVHEAALVASLGNPEVLSLVIATSRDDGGAAPVVGPSGAAGGRFRPVVILSPLVVGAARDCSGTLDPSARIASWGATLDPSRVQVIDTACPSWQNEVASAGLLDPGLTADRVDEIGCLPSPLAKLAGGEAACTVEVTMEDDGPCRSHLGMLDPSAGDGVRRPRRIAEGGVLKRVCEVSELLGPQAESCRTTLDCAGCGPGWCTTDLWGTGCSSANRLFLRFVEGALPRGQASVRIVCDLQP